MFTKNKPLTGNGYSLNELKESIFFNVNIKYDITLKKYIYWVDNIVEDKDINIQLYQAKIK